MVRNLSLKAEDEFDDKLYSVAKSKGMSKSAFIRLELEKAIDRERPEDSASNLRELTVKQLENKISDETLNRQVVNTNVNMVKEEKKSNIEIPKEEKKVSIDIQSVILNKENQPPSYTELIPNITHTEPAKTKESGDDVNRLDLLIDKKITDTTKLNLQDLQITPKVEELNKQSEKKDIIEQSKLKSKFVIKRKVNRVNDEEAQRPVISERDVEHLLDKRLKEKEFGKAFEEVHKKIQNIDDRVCKDGECTKNEFSNLNKRFESTNSELSNLRKDLSKLDTLCEDGKCLKNDVTELRKSLEDVKKVVSKEKFHCPGCQEKILEIGDSYCRNCKTEINAWDELPEWKPFKLRNVRK